MTNWPKRLAGMCENHSCPTNKTCVIEKRGSNEFTNCTDDTSPLDKGYTKAPILPFFYKTYTAKKNYVDASKTCQDEGARLIEPDTEEKNTFIRGIIDEQNMDNVFFGLTDFQDIGDYRWTSNNSTLTFNDWEDNEPQLGIGEFCAAFYKGLAWQWINIFCHWKLQFMCEITFA
ncbi:perlucin-like protein [Gigantopelta aegis]|uniref:perlucin-like protein n=1 Tax=Gigantopelta aegis TaxID=1735272 RepID=UPI001B887D26|nr:perlucin-like protein [Gigantopelta aegis]